MPPAINAQDGQMSDILSVIEGAQRADARPVVVPWWQSKTGDPIRPDAQQYHTSINELVQLAVANSARVSVARHVPLIRQTSVTEAAAAFDWTNYAETMWLDTSNPVGSTLTVGGSASVYRDQHWTGKAGLKRRLLTGGNFDIRHEAGYQYTNSSFFVPQDQATSRIVLGFTQPLLRGRGRAYNSSLIVLAQIDVDSADVEFQRQLQSHLMEVVSGYWSLYLERSSLAQKYKLYLRTKEIFGHLDRRQSIDAQRTQLVSAEAAVETRESDLIRSVAAVKNAETRLRSLINAPELSGDPNQLELIPVDHPTTVEYPADLYSEFSIAMVNRPELRAAINTIKAASIRLAMSENEILPQLDLVTEMYVAGLRGDSQWGDAWVDQFRNQEPSYSVGFQYEMALGRRAAKARTHRRQLELSQFREEYRDALQSVRAEVEVAVRELRTAYKELMAKDQARNAAEQEAATLESRWRQMVDGVAAGLSLEALLRSQERVNQAEYELSKALLTYNLSLTNLRKANGTLLQIVDGVGDTMTASLDPPVQMVGTPSSPSVDYGATFVPPNNSEVISIDSSTGPTMEPTRADPMGPILGQP